MKGEAACRFYGINADNTLPASALIATDRDAMSSGTYASY